MDLEEIKNLLAMSGTDVLELDIATLRVDDCVEIKTRSENRYLLKIIDPQTGKMHFYRHEQRGQAPAGYRGERYMKETLRVGQRVAYSGSPDKAQNRCIGTVTNIILLKY